MVRALAHPLRARILGVLQERKASPRELADELGAPLGNVSYHVRTLASLKLIKLVQKTPRRGAIEHHYVATAAARVSDKAWRRAPGVVKKAMVASALDEVGRSVSEAASMGGFDREDAHLTRSRLVLDERGWRELAQALHRLLESTEAIQRESERRLARANHGTEMSASLVMLLFETMPALEPLPAEAGQASDHKRAGARAPSGAVGRRQGRA